MSLSTNKNENKTKCFACFGARIIGCDDCDATGVIYCMCRYCGLNKVHKCSQAIRGVRGNCFKCKGRAYFKCSSCIK